MGFPPHVGRVREERVLPRVLPPGDALAVQEDETSEGRREEGGRSRHGAGPRRHKLAVPGSRQAPLEGGAGVAEDHRARAEGEDAGPMGYGIAARRSFFPRQEGGGGGGGGRGRPAVLQHPADVLEPQFQLRGSQAGCGGAGSPAGRRSGPPRGAAPPPGSRRPREGERPAAAGCRQLRRRRAGGGGASAAPTAPAPSSSSSSSSDLFAAGFMAATTFHSIQIRSMLESAFLAGLPVPAAIAAATAAVPPAAANLGHALGLLRAGGVPVPVGTGGAYHHAPSAPPPPPQPPPPPNPVPASGGSPLLRRPFRLRQRRQ